MHKIHLVVLPCVLVLLSLPPAAKAADYNCPAPNLVNCVPAQNTVAGWQDNGGQKTGNSFAPNNQCGNIISLPHNATRLVCCYTNCGVFVHDVQAAQCTKQSQSHFVCN